MCAGWVLRPAVDLAERDRGLPVQRYRGPVQRVLGRAGLVLHALPPLHCVGCLPSLSLQEI